MTISVTYKQLQQAAQSGALNQLVSAHIPLKQMTALARLTKEINGALEVADNARVEKLKVYGTAPEGDAKEYSFASPELEKQFQDEVRELSEASISFNFEKLPLSELIKAPIVAKNPYFPSAGELAQLDWLIDMGEEAEAVAPAKKKRNQ